MKRLLLEMFLWLCNIVGLNAIFRRRTANKLRILMYHGVTRERFPIGYWLLVHEPNFENQMRYLSKHYRTVGGKELSADREPKQPTAGITFDDGLLNVLEVAVPVLQKYNLPAICFAVPSLSERQQEIPSEEIFDTIMRTEKYQLDLTSLGLDRITIPTDYDSRTKIGIDLNRNLKLLPEGSTGPALAEIRKQLAPPNRDATSPFKLMTVTQLQQFASDPLFEIGGHTDNHVTLPSVTDRRQAEEIDNCLDKLRKWNIEPSPIFCFPSGRYNDFSRAHLAGLGITHAVGTHDGLHPFNGDKLAMKRVSVGANTGINEFRARLSGLYYVLFGETV